MASSSPMKPTISTLGLRRGGASSPRGTHTPSPIPTKSCATSNCSIHGSTMLTPSLASSLRSSPGSASLPPSRQTDPLPSRLASDSSSPLAPYWPHRRVHTGDAGFVGQGRINPLSCIHHPVARGGIEPPTFRFSGGRDVTYEAFVLVKLDELDQSWGSRAHNPN